MSKAKRKGPGPRKAGSGSDFVDIFKLLKYPERCKAQSDVIEKVLAGRTLEQWRRKFRDRARQEVENFDPAFLTGLKALNMTVDDLLDAKELRIARSRGGRYPRHLPAMHVAAKAFLDAEKGGDTFAHAVNRARDQIDTTIDGTPPDEKTIGLWLRSLIDFNLTSIAPPVRGRPPK